jgi:hypothetical protein
MKILIAYAKFQPTDIKISGELKKMIELNNKGELEEYLKRFKMDSYALCLLDEESSQQLFYT